jgi:hypothetical protein
MLVTLVASLYPVMSSTASASPHPRFSTVGLTERDLEPVQFLLRRAQENTPKDSFETPQFLFAISTWLNAFAQFKHQRRNVGLPSGKAAKYAYGVVLAQLKMVGKAMAVVIQSGQIDLNLLPVSVENFEACVRELQCDDALLEMGLLDSDYDIGSIAEIYGEPSAGAATAAS